MASSVSSRSCGSALAYLSEDCLKPYQVVILFMRVGQAFGVCAVKIPIALAEGVFFFLPFFSFFFSFFFLFFFSFFFFPFFFFSSAFLSSFFLSLFFPPFFPVSSFSLDSSAEGFSRGKCHVVLI